MSYEIGDVWSPQLTVTNAAGALTAATVVATVTSPAGTVSTPTVTTPSLGVYTTTVALSELGQWTARWVVSGAVTGAETTYADVRGGNGGVTVAAVRARLNKSLTVDDDELTEMIDAALAEYEQLVGPLGSVTARFAGGRASIVLPVGASQVTAAAYDDGTTIDLADLDLDTATGILHWGYNTAGVFTYGSRNVTLTYTVALPANHREAIIADVAGYFAATQRGGGTVTPRFPGEGYAEAYEAPGTPLTLFPRIRALAARMPSIA